MPKAVRDQLALIERLCESSTHLTEEVEREIEREAEIDSHLRSTGDGDEAGEAVWTGPRRPDNPPVKGLDGV